jgi:triosephosphate isomerase
MLAAVRAFVKSWPAKILIGLIIVSFGFFGARDVFRNRSASDAVVKAGEALAVVTRQVRGSLPPELAGKAFSVAYEPVWAIGTGLTPTTPEIEEIHRAVRAALVEAFGPAGAKTPILYGGSVKPANAAEILHADQVGGALVGGASLKAEDFLGIIRAA